MPPQFQPPSGNWADRRSRHRIQRRIPSSAQSPERSPPPPPLPLPPPTASDQIQPASTNVPASSRAASPAPDVRQPDPSVSNGPSLASDRYSLPFRLSVTAVYCRWGALIIAFGLLVVWALRPFSLHAPYPTSVLDTSDLNWLTWLVEDVRNFLDTSNTTRCDRDLLSKPNPTKLWNQTAVSIAAFDAFVIQYLLPSLHNASIRQSCHEYSVLYKHIAHTEDLAADITQELYESQLALSIVLAAVVNANQTALQTCVRNKAEARSTYIAVFQSSPPWPMDQLWRYIRGPPGDMSYDEAMRCTKPLGYAIRQLISSFIDLSPLIDRFKNLRSQIADAIGYVPLCINIENARARRSLIKYAESKLLDAFQEAAGASLQGPVLAKWYRSL